MSHYHQQAIDDNTDSTQAKFWGELVVRRFDRLRRISRMKYGDHSTLAVMYHWFHYRERDAASLRRQCASIEYQINAILA